MKNDILAALKDLHKQATEDRSHCYVAKCSLDAIEEITMARDALIAMVQFSATRAAEGLVDNAPELEAVRAYLRRNS